MRGAAAARAAADNLVKRLSKERDEARKECQFLQDAFASAIADGDIGDRVLALVPALSDLVNGRRPSGLRRLRRNVALHAVAEGIDSIATAGGPSLRRAAKGARLDNLVAFREPPVECIVEVCYAEAPVKSAVGPTAWNLAASVFVPGALGYGVVLQSAEEQVDALLQALAAAAPVCGARPPDTVYAEGGGAPADLQPVALLEQQGAHSGGGMCGSCSDPRGAAEDQHDVEGDRRVADGLPGGADGGELDGCEFCCDVMSDLTEFDMPDLFDGEMDAEVSEVAPGVAAAPPEDAMAVWRCPCRGVHVPIRKAAADFFEELKRGDWQWRPDWGSMGYSLDWDEVQKLSMTGEAQIETLKADIETECSGLPWEKCAAQVRRWIRHHVVAKDLAALAGWP